MILQLPNARIYHFLGRRADLGELTWVEGEAVAEGFG